MKAQDLKNSILQMAMEGKLVPQDPNDEPASVLLERIMEEKEQLIKEKKIKRNNKESVIFRKNNHFYEKIGKKGEEVCIDDEIPWNIPDNWEWCKLGFIGDWKSGSTPKRGESKYYENGTIPWLKTGDLNNGIITEIPEFITEIALEETSVRLNPIGSVLIAMYGATIGKVGILDIEATTNQACCACIPFNGIFNKFLFYYLMSQNKKFNDMSEGGAQPNISRTKIVNYLFPLPPLKEQKRIVKQIESIMPFIYEYDDLNNKLKELNNNFPNKIKDSILQEAIQGKLVPQDPDNEPASVLLEKIRAEKERLVEEKIIKKNKNESVIFKENNHFYEKIGNKEPVCIDNEILFEIPNNWQWCRMENIIQLISGRDMKSNEYNDNKNGIPYITGASNIENNNLIINRWIENPGVISIKNDILLTCKGTIGKLLVLNEPKVHIARQIMAIRIFDENLIFVDFVLLILKYYVNKLQNKAKSMIPGISREDVLKILVPLPPINEQKNIVDKLKNINK